MKEFFYRRKYSEFLKFCKDIYENYSHNKLGKGCSFEYHNTIIFICFCNLVGNMILLEPGIEILHLAREFLDIINHNQCIRSAFWKGSKEVVEIFFFHRIDEDKIKIPISQRWDNCFCVSPDAVNVFHFAVPKVLYGFYVSIPSVLDGGDGKS